MVFHTVTELISVLVSWSIFVIAVNTHQYSRNSFFMFLGIAYAFIGAIDLLYILSYEGMNILLVENANIATQLWIGSRFFESVSILISTLYLTRTLNIRRMTLAYSSVFTLMIISIFQLRIFPLSNILGIGLTSFSVISEYIISCILIVAILFVRQNRNRFQDNNVYRNIVIAYGATIFSGLLLTTHIDAFNLSNMLGHFLKMISSFYIYKAMVETNLNHPYHQLAQVNKQLEQEIADRELAEAKRKQYEKEWNKLAKLNSIANLASGLTHDFKNLLTIILGNSSLIERATQEAKVLEHNKHLMAAAMQAVEVTNGLLSFSKDGRPNKEPVDIKRLVLQTTQMALSGSNVQASIQAQDDLIAAADPAQIKQVINNLVINALQAMPNGGCLNICIQEKKLKPIVENLPITQGKYIIISLQDQGIGISKNHLEQIFDPFFTTKKSGHGLGLARSFTIIKNHGGYIAVSSQLGRGTTFTIYLPTMKQCKKGGGKPNPANDLRAAQDEAAPTHDN